MKLRDVPAHAYREYKLKVPDDIYQQGKDLIGMHTEMYVFGPVNGVGFFLSKTKPTLHISDTPLVQFNDPKSILEWEIIQ